jgi:hypothetical protein
MKMPFKEYAKQVTRKLGISSVNVYGDMIRDLYDTGESVEECVKFCRDEDAEWEQGEAAALKHTKRIK